MTGLPFLVFLEGFLRFVGLGAGESESEESPFSFIFRILSREIRFRDSLSILVFFLFSMRSETFLVKYSEGKIPI